MMDLHDPLKRFVDLFSRVPSVGPRQAIRIAYHLIRLDPSQRRELQDAIASLESISTCPRCFFPHQHATETLCAICRNTNRDQRTIAIIEKETDLLSLERSRTYNGRYFIIGVARVNSENKMRETRLAILKKQIAEECGGTADEIILAISPTTYGEVAAATLMKELQPLTARISRLGRGIPVGGEIEFADEETLREAIRRRR